jgi:predicted RNA-binding protein YlqC (UPF0109 family)
MRQSSLARGAPMSTRFATRVAPASWFQRVSPGIRRESSMLAGPLMQCPRQVLDHFWLIGFTRHYHQAFGLIVRRINDEPFDVPSVPGSRAVTIKFMIPNSRMGSVIGKQGSKIKEIQDASGARLNASEGMLPGSTEVSIMYPRNFGVETSYAI